jgi:hypothetical protein
MSPRFGLHALDKRKIMLPGTEPRLPCRPVHSLVNNLIQRTQTKEQTDIWVETNIQVLSA